MGELLVSKEGIGYLIMYGSQVFNLNLVMTGVVLLVIISCILYYLISYLERKLVRNQKLVFFIFNNFYSNNKYFLNKISKIYKKLSNFVLNFKIT